MKLTFQPLVVPRCRFQQAGAARVLDVRLNNSSQLAGFTKKDDLEFFLKAIAGIGYIHLPELAPTQDILTAYKKEKGDWSVYEPKFLGTCLAGQNPRKQGVFVIFRFNCPKICWFNSGIAMAQFEKRLVFRCL